MKKVLYAVLALVGLVLVGSQMIPAEWKVTRTIVIHAEPQALYPLVADWRNWDQWSAFKTPDMTFEFSGKASGVGAICRVKAPNMEVENEIIEADPAKGIVYACRVKGFDPGTCGLAFSPEGSGTKVTFTYAGTVGRNPLHRFFGLMADKAMGKPLSDGLANLKKVAEEKPRKK
jgi:hypothetical protein